MDGNLFMETENPWGGHSSLFPVQWDGPECRLDEGIIRCIWQLLPGNNWVYTPLHGAWAFPPCGSWVIRANLIFTPNFAQCPTTLQSSSQEAVVCEFKRSCSHACTSQILPHIFSAHSMLTGSQTSISLLSTQAAANCNTQAHLSCVSRTPQLTQGSNC